VRSTVVAVDCHPPSHSDEGDESPLQWLVGSDHSLPCGTASSTTETAMMEKVLDMTFIAIHISINTCGGVSWHLVCACKHTFYTHICVHVCAQFL